MNPLWEQASKACQGFAQGHDPSNCRVCLAIYTALRSAVAEEREACARLVEAGLEDDDAGLSDEICRRDVDLAAAIRARGQS